jgi:Rrf2 family protein
MLTRKGKYGLKALVHLASLDPGEVALVNTIAEANNIPKKFLEAIMSDLRKAAIVYAKKGKGGGYALARKPEEIHVGHVIRVLDGPLAPIACASQNFFQRCDDCPDQNACAVRLLMLHVRTAIANVLDNKTRRASQSARREAQTRSGTTLIGPTKSELPVTA